MEIAVYEVRADEREHLAEMEAQYGVKLRLFGEPMTMENMEGAMGCLGVSTLGFSDLSAPVMRRLAEMGVRCLSLRCIGYNHVDLDAAREWGLRVSNASYPPGAVADFTILLMLLTLRKYKPAMWRQQVNDYSLDGLSGREMGSMKVGVVGTGRIGAQVMKQLSGFGCESLCYDVRRNPESERYGTYAALGDLYRECDLLTLHVPLMEETYHMIDERAIAKMRDGVVLINAARGELCDIKALIAGVESQKLGALGMDVFENEKGIYHHSLISDIIKNRDMAYLRQFPNVVLTQHMAFYTQESVRSMVRCGVEGIVKLLRGEEYPHTLV